MSVRFKTLRTMPNAGAGSRAPESAIALIALVFLPLISFAHGGISGGIGALQGIITLGFIALGLAPLLWLVWLLRSKKAMKVLPRLLLTLIVLIGLFVAFSVLYVFGKSWLVLILFIETCLMTCLLILLLSKNRRWRLSMLTALGGLIVAINLAYPRLVDFYQREHVDNSFDYLSYDFKYADYWRGMLRAQGRQLLVTVPSPAELRSAELRDDYAQNQVRAMKRDAKVHSPAILLKQPDKAGYFDIIELLRTPESYITTKRVYFTLPILGQRTVLRYQPKVIGEVAQLDDKLQPAEEYLREVLGARWHDIARGEQTLKQRHAYWAAQLMKLDFDPNYRSAENQASLLQVAIASQHLSAAKSLIARGADIEHVNQWGETALHNAVFSGSSFVELLLKNGAVTNLKNRSGQTLLEQARRYLRGDKVKSDGVWMVDTETEKYQDRLKVIEILEAHLKQSG